MISELRRLFAHLTWADRRILERLRRSGEPEAAAVRLFAHLLGSQRLWLVRLRGGDTSALEVWPDLTLADCAEVLEENTRGYQAFLDALKDVELDRPVEYRTSVGKEYRTRTGDILFHVVIHASHHRGQINRQLREGGEEPVNVDYITFVREGLA